MYQLVLAKQKEKKYIYMLIGFFLGFLLIYLLLDHLNGGYAKMIQTYGLYLVIINGVLNVVMAFLSAWMFNLSQALVTLTKKDSKASNVPILSVIFGIFTYGCTSCVIAFLSTIGITFSVAVLPLAGLPYKIGSFVILIIGYFFVIRSIKKSQCKI